MLNEELKTRIAELVPTATIEDPADPNGWLTVNIEPALWAGLSLQLREQADFYFDYLFCVTCVDWKTHLTMVYHLESTQYRHIIVVKSKLDRTLPRIESVSHIWRTADFHEREVYELFGVNFLNHPDLRLLILPDGWEVKNPLRKDFEDTVNMIKL